MASLALNQLTISRGWGLSTLLALAMLVSAIVFREPAPVDLVMACFIVAMCLFGDGRLGPVTALNLVIWLVLVALSLAVTVYSPDFGEAVKHQFVTLFLALGAVAIAAFIAQDPEPRARLVLNYYTAAIVVACLLGYIGYFQLFPGAYELFTNYGRARGSFKDPNVFGAAVGPAMTYLVWLLLRHPTRQSLVPGMLFLFMAPALLISFSRGAWISLAVSLAVLGAIALMRTRRRSDHMRMAIYSVVGLATIVVTVMAVMQIPKVSKLMQQRASLTQGYDEGPEGRFGGQAKAVKLILENPFGIGTHTFRERHHHEEVHNVYLTMFHYAGWLGGLLFITSVLLTLVFGLNYALQFGALQGMLVVAVASFVGLVVEGLVIENDHWRHFFIMLALIWGLCDAQRSRSPISSPRRWSDPLSVSLRQ
ncbi:MAG: hypothetical protein ACI89J_001381 [Hyphomicrobiaceae bacterium]|jgi:hypothetical protein